MQPMVGIVYDPVMEKHYHPSEPHLERPERLSSIYHYLEQMHIMPQLTSIESRIATQSDLELAHTSKYLNKIFTILENRKPLKDPDMYLNSDTLIAALTAAGSTLQITDAILTKRITSGFALVRPPGHHASPEKCMGFCFFNNIGIAAIHAANLGKRVLIVDIDVHHGNGTENLVKNHKDIRNLYFMSIHRYDSGTFYPGTGKSKDEPPILNIGFNGSKGDSYYISKFENVIGPRAQAFNPEIILVSAGFDAAVGDPLGGCSVTPNGYYQMIKLLTTVCPNILLVLEGGYNIDSIAQSALAAIRALL